MVDETQKSLKLSCGAWCTMPKNYHLDESGEKYLEDLTVDIESLMRRKVHTVFLNQDRDAHTLELHSINFVFDKTDLEA